MNIPFVDLPLQHQMLADEIAQAIRGVIERSDFILGEELVRFEEEFAAFCQARYAVSVDNGMSALELAMRAYGIGPGDEVILPAHTFIATVATVSAVGARPVLVDVDPLTYNIDCTQIEAAITRHTRAIMPVHLYGLPADMDKILTIASQHHLIVIEDACQAHGALYKARRVGSIGNASAFSFYPGKNMGALGDGGILVTNDAQIAERVRNMRNYGQTAKYHHDYLPLNRRLDTIQAAVLRVKLRYLDDWNKARRRVAALYTQLLAGCGVVTPSEAPDSTHVYHLYIIRVWLF
jgi:dTDP-4-amino-4,6-dideoxygalactose transaminase